MPTRSRRLRRPLAILLLHPSGNSTTTHVRLQQTFGGPDYRDGSSSCQHQERSVKLVAHSERRSEFPLALSGEVAAAAGEAWRDPGGGTRGHHPWRFLRYLHSAAIADETGCNLPSPRR